MVKKLPPKKDMQKIRELIGLNFDACRYFFSRADEKWLVPLWKNGLFDKLKEKAKDPTKYSYKSPELDYLVRIAEKEPKKVADIILSVPISDKTFNPEVVARFTDISSILPAEQLARIVPKINHEKWTVLMSVFDRWGFEYEKMLKTLEEAGDYKNILVLADALLFVGKAEDLKKGFGGISFDSPFCFNDLSYTKVFEYLASVNDAYLESAFALLIQTISEIVLLGGKSENEVFKIKDSFYLFDVDLFTLEPGQKKHLSSRDSVKELIATIKVLSQRLFKQERENHKETISLYKKYIKNLPDSRSMWRLRLFILSLCPEVFKEELEKCFFIPFEVERYHEFTSGTEYKKALRLSFHVLPENKKRDYINKVFKYFTRETDDEKEKSWLQRDAWRILSSIASELSKNDKEKCKELFGKKPDPSFTPEPTISSGIAGTVISQGPISPDEFNDLPIAEIVDNLKTIWNPAELKKKDKEKNILRPLNAEGAGEQLKLDIPKRFQEYINDAGLFFKRNVLDQHYTYSFFRGVQDALRNNREVANNINWDSLLKMLLEFKASGEQEPFAKDDRERDNFDVWLAGWTGVHLAAVGVVKELLSEYNEEIIIDFKKYREGLFKIISYLLSYPDPEPKDEQNETATSRTQRGGRGKYLVSDPYSMAINSVRGEAFEAFASFVYQDGKQFNKKEKIKIAPEVKKIYEDVLNKENTKALMFMFGHYLPSFYFRDVEWIRGLLPKIFPASEKDKLLYIAAWEGYLANNLFKEIFTDPRMQKLYKRGLHIFSSDDPDREFFRRLEKGIATHIALAFLHYKDFNFDHPLFKEFWSDDLERQAEFVEFIGSLFISGKNHQIDETFSSVPFGKKRLMEVWDWLLENFNNPKIFVGFGFWINLEKNIFEIPWLAKRARLTLEKTKGQLNWDYGLTTAIIEFAQKAPEDALQITKLYFWDGGVRSPEKQRIPLRADKEWFEAFKILYSKKETKEKTFDLIDKLVGEGFWNLKEIIKETD